MGASRALVHDVPDAEIVLLSSIVSIVASKAIVPPSATSQLAAAVAAAAVATLWRRLILSGSPTAVKMWVIFGSVANYFHCLFSLFFFIGAAWVTLFP